MWILPSKHADARIKRMAQSLASALPEGRFVRRGEQALARLQTLARREAEDAILIASTAPQSEGPDAFVLRARRYRRGTDGVGHWAWEPQELIISHLKTGPVPAREALEGETYTIEAEGRGAGKLADWLGLRSHPLAAFYEEAGRLGVRIQTHADARAVEEAAEGEMHITAQDEPLLRARYRWGPLNQAAAR